MSGQQHLQLARAAPAADNIAQQNSESCHLHIRVSGSVLCASSTTARLSWLSLIGASKNVHSLLAHLCSRMLLRLQSGLPKGAQLWPG